MWELGVRPRKLGCVLNAGWVGPWPTATPLGWRALLGLSLTNSPGWLFCYPCHFPFPGVLDAVSLSFPWLSFSFPRLSLLSIKPLLLGLCPKHRWQEHFSCQIRDHLVNWAQANESQSHSSSSWEKDVLTSVIFSKLQFSGRQKFWTKWMFREILTLSQEKWSCQLHLQKTDLWIWKLWNSLFLYLRSPNVSKTLLLHFPPTLL